jgi:muramoyltetrapeptide carboxypeptidase LdcA involved in peptidoglycan recycling
VLACRKDHIPVIADADFGHTSPLCTLPIGGYSYTKAYENNIEIIIED